MMLQVDDYLDRVKSGRFPDRTYMSAINDAIITIVNDRIEPLKQKKTYSVQATQRVRDELQPLIPTPILTLTTTVVANVGTIYSVTKPADYHYYLELYAKISGVRYFCIPMSYNDRGEIMDNPFRKPSATKPYFTEGHLGIHIQATDTIGSTTVAPTAVEFYYIKKPNVVSIGQERHKIVAGGTLTNALTYYVYDESVYSGVTYAPGESIAGSGAALTSGTVILSTNTTLSDLPDSMYYEICTKAASIMSGNGDDFAKKQLLNNDVDKA